MNEFFQKLKKEALHTKLSQNEKLHMRAALYDAIKQTPDFFEKVKVMRAVKSPYVWFSPAYASAFAVVLIVALSTGTAYAAQGALPGDLLYSIKINVNEQVEVRLALDDNAKAQAEATIAVRRVEEAQELEAQGRLDATTTQELEDNFNEHAERALAFGVAQPVTAAFSQTTQPQEEQDGADTASSSIKSATLTRVAPSPKVEDRATTQKIEKEDIPKSLEKQRKIFNELKLRVKEHKGGGEEGSNDTSSTSNISNTSNTSNVLNTGSKQNTVDSRSNDRVDDERDDKGNDD